MKKILPVFIFIFLAGLFSGVFYSMSLSSESSHALSDLMLSATGRDSVGFFPAMLSFIRTNLILLILMVPAVFSRFLCPLPPVLLWYKSFSLGFCSGLLYIYDPGRAFMVSLVNMIPQNIFFVPAFIIFSAVTFQYSVSTADSIKRNRAFVSQKALKYTAAAVLVTVIAGSAAAALLSRISV